MRIKFEFVGDVWIACDEQGQLELSVCNGEILTVADEDVDEGGEPVNPHLREALKAGVAKIVESEG